MQSLKHRGLNQDRGQFRLGAQDQEHGRVGNSVSTPSQPLHPFSGRQKKAPRAGASIGVVETRERGKGF